MKNNQNLSQCDSEQTPLFTLKITIYAPSSRLVSCGVSSVWKKYVWYRSIFVLSRYQQRLDTETRQRCICFVGYLVWKDWGNSQKISWPQICSVLCIYCCVQALDYRQHLSQICSVLCIYCCVQALDYCQHLSQLGSGNLCDDGKMGWRMKKIIKQDWLSPVYSGHLQHIRWNSFYSDTPGHWCTIRG